MSRWRCAFLISLSLAAGLAQAGSFSAELHSVPKFHHADRNSAFYLPPDVSPFHQYTLQNELELTGSSHGVSGMVTLRNLLRSEVEPNDKFIIKTLYWEGELAGQDLTLGKQIQSFGVGFGFRPLDILQYEDRRRLYQNTLEGIPAMAWQHYTAEDAWGLFYANPGQGDSQREKDNESLTLKVYRLQGDSDLHGLLQWSDRHQLQAGGGIAHVLGDAWEIHASLLYQRQGQRLLNPLAGTDDFPLATSDITREQTIDHAIKALLGGHWTTESGWSVLGEVWYDGEAYSAQQWRDLAQLSRAQRALLDTPGVPDAAVFGNIAASTQAFANTNLLRWNTLFRVSHDSDRLDPSLEVLFTPEDIGYVVTLNAEYQFTKHTLNLRVRTFGGAPESAYRLLPEDWVVMLAWEWTFL